jgi:hypothetical protein
MERGQLTSKLGERRSSNHRKIVLQKAKKEIVI